jgi:hypothetical protein
MVFDLDEEAVGDAEVVGDADAVVYVDRLHQILIFRAVIPHVVFFSPCTPFRACPP